LSLKLKWFCRYLTDPLKIKPEGKTMRCYTLPGQDFFTPEETLVRNLLFDVTFNSKYSFYDLTLQRRLSFEEVLLEVESVLRERVLSVCRPMYREQAMRYIDKFVKYFRERKLFPSMRLVQFSRMVPHNHTRLYNCSYTPVDSIDAIAELFYLMLCGVGVGYSVERKYVEQLPTVYPENAEEELACVVEDSIEGWAEALRRYLYSRFTPNHPRLVLDYSRIRPEGSIIGKRYNAAFGYTKNNPIAEAVAAVKDIFDRAVYRKLRPIEVHDLITTFGMIINRANVRGMAAIVFFDYDDEEMLQCKNFEKGEVPPNRWYANNSVVLYRVGDQLRGAKGEPVSLQEIFMEAFRGKSGEPGIFVTQDEHYRTNPCGEASLYKNFCNLTEIAMPNVQRSEIVDVVNTAVFIGVLQATFTDFKFLRNVWKERTEEDALLGVSLTGIYEALEMLPDYMRLSTKGHIKYMAAEFAKWFDINVPARITLVKPSGTVSLLAGTSPGCHPPYAPFFIRRNRISNDSALLRSLEGYPFLEDDLMYEDKKVIAFPLRARRLFKHDPEFQVNLRNQIMRGWVEPSHNRGTNTHNVSITVYVENEAEVMRISKLLENEKNISGITILPVLEHSYKQAPFERLSEEDYAEMITKVHVFMEKNRYRLSGDLSSPRLILTDESDELSGEKGCAGLACYLDL